MYRYFHWQITLTGYWLLTTTSCEAGNKQEQIQMVTIAIYKYISFIFSVWYIYNIELNRRMASAAVRHFKVKDPSFAWPRDEKDSMYTAHRKFSNISDTCWIFRLLLYICPDGVCQGPQTGSETKQKIYIYIYSAFRWRKVCQSYNWQSSPV